MNEFFEPRERTISSMIASHKRARAHRRTLERSAKSRWSQLRYPMLIFERWRERKAMLRLIRMAPTTAEGARSKLLYLMATIMVDGAHVRADDIETVLDTLRPHQDSLTAFLRQ